MEVVVGGEEPVPHDRPYDSTALSKDFMPVAWAAAYGQTHSHTLSFLYILYMFIFEKRDGDCSRSFIVSAFIDEFMQD